ncbi:MAG: FAD-dependent oxidoreductase [Spirulinaceae cyanobacterium]
MSSISAVVAQVSDLQEGEMQEVSVEKTKVLLARVEGKFFATGANCTHYGAKLINGVLKGDRLVCPWHNACFGVKSGEMLEPPGLDDLPAYKVEIKGDDVVVTVPENAPQQCVPEMASYDADADSRVFIILGAGVAGINAAETLRKAGFLGKVVMLTAEDELPYDRTMLSKKYLQEKSDDNSLPLRSQQFYQEHDIEVLTNHRVKEVDATQKQITFSDNSTMNYDALLLATGCKARKLDIPGFDLANVFTLHNHEDAQQIVAAAKKASQAVVIGSSFIGMEVAASLRKQDLAVTVISPDAVPFASILGEEIGQIFRQVHEKNGVVFHKETKATKFVGNSKVEEVILKDSTSLPADLVVVGVGVEPATSYLKGVELNEKDHSIPTNEYLQVKEGLYAAGDIARFPYWQTEKPTRIEHWRLAAQHGRIAAYNMAGKEVKFKGIPFFWTGQYNLKLRYAGHATSWDEVIIEGNLEEQEFIAYYIKDQQVLAVAGCNQDQEIAAITELMRQKTLNKEDLALEKV